MYQLRYELNEEIARGLLPRRDDTQAKWHFGRTLLVCGSGGMSGAALLAGQAALRSGAGLVQLASAPEVIAAARVALPEALLLPLAEDMGWDALALQAKKAQSLLFGCGVGISDRGRRLLAGLTEGYGGTLVLDADGLNLLSENTALLYKVSGRCILTPHIGEFCRLTGLTRPQVEADPAGAAMDFAARYRVVVVLKGAATVITDGVRRYELHAPNSGMAKGGSGDVLAGLTAGLAAQMPDEVLECAALAVWLHSRAGQLARQDLGAYAMLPREVLSCLGRAFLELEG